MVWEKNDGGVFATMRVANNPDDSKMRSRQRLYKKLTESGLLRLMFVLLVVNETKITSTAVRESSMQSDTVIFPCRELRDSDSERFHSLSGNPVARLIPSVVPA